MIDVEEWKGRVEVQKWIASIRGTDVLLLDMIDVEE